MTFNRREIKEGVCLMNKSGYGKKEIVNLKWLIFAVVVVFSFGARAMAMDLRKFEIKNQHDGEIFMEKAREESIDTLIALLTTECKKKKNPPTKAFVLTKVIFEKVNQNEDGSGNLKLLNLVKTKRNPERLKFLALNAISKPNRVAATQLISIIEDERASGEIRAEAIKALNDLQPDAEVVAFPFLKSFIESNSDEDLARGALFVFKGKNYAPIVETLVAGLESENSSMRTRSASVLGQLSNIKSLSVDRPQIIPSLVVTMYDSDEYVANAAIRALSFMDEKSVMSEFKRVMKQSRETDPADGQRKRWTMARALGSMEGQGSADLLIEFIDDPDELVAANAADSISQRKIRKALPELKNRSKKLGSDDFINKKFEKAIQSLEMSK